MHFVICVFWPYFWLPMNLRVNIFLQGNLTASAFDGHEELWKQLLCMYLYSDTFHYHSTGFLHSCSDESHIGNRSSIPLSDLWRGSFLTLSFSYVSFVNRRSEYTYVCSGSFYYHHSMRYVHDHSCGDNNLDHSSNLRIKKKEGDVFFRINFFETHQSKLINQWM